MPVKVVHAEGNARHRGRQIGRELGELIERSLGFYRDYFERRGITSDQLQDFLTPFLASSEQSCPQLAATITGMAEGAMAPVWELFAVNAFEELEPTRCEHAGGHASFLERDVGRPPADERCSSFTAVGPGFTLVGHNEQWLAGDDGNVAVVIEHPDRGSAVASPTVACCLGAVGMNEHGGAQAIQSVVAGDDGVGVPRVLVSRRSLEAADRMDAVSRAGFDQRAGGYGHVFAFPGGDAFMVETSGRRRSVLNGPGPHTNHYLDPELAAIAPPASDGSLARYERLLDLLEEREPSTPVQVMDILRDHAGGPHAICVHPDPTEGDEASGILFSMVADVEAGRMWVATGNPCTTSFEEIDLAGVR